MADRSRGLNIARTFAETASRIIFCKCTSVKVATSGESVYKHFLGGMSAALYPSGESVLFPPVRCGYMFVVTCFSNKILMLLAKLGVFQVRVWTM